MSQLISIVTPTFNEEENIEKLCSSIREMMSGIKYDYEHIVIDNCSTDNTIKLLKNIASTDKKLKMVASSIRDRVKRKVKSMAANEDYIPEEGYDQIKDRIAMAGGDPSSPKKMDATKYPVSKEIKNQKGKTVLQKQSEKKYGKGATALDIVRAKIKKGDL